MATAERGLDPKRIVIVGNGDPAHVGAHLRVAADASGLATTFCDVQAAYEAPSWIARANWWLRGRRPTRLRSFSQHVLDACRACRATHLISTGIAPVDRATLEAIGALGVRRVNYLTDDPWNPRHRAPWFLEALPAYDEVFSTRRAVLDDLRAAGGRGVAYLPFAYAPHLHYPEPPAASTERARFAADVVFAGGADSDRVPILAALGRAGLRLALYGGYWDRYPATRAYARGHAEWSTLRKAFRGARIALCLVRRANRDGHAMRTFETAATGACMLTEETDEHRELLGDDGECTLYFRSAAELVDRARWLLAHEADRERLARALHRRIGGAEHTYGARLAVMLASRVSSAPCAAAS